jgi:hypothetical protein
MASKNSQGRSRIEESGDGRGAVVRRILARRGYIGNAGRSSAMAGGARLYCTMNTGDRTINHPRFQLQPLMNQQDDIEALALNILGLSFVLLLAPPDESKYPFLKGARYRPGRIAISYPASTNWLTMRWDDGRSHEALTVQFVQPISSP